jgi:hypothetical protein
MMLSGGRAAIDIFHGIARVPTGETFSRPTTGPQTVYNPSNP